MHSLPRKNIGAMAVGIAGSAGRGERHASSVASRKTGRVPSFDRRRVPRGRLAQRLRAFARYGRRARVHDERRAGAGCHGLGNGSRASWLPSLLRRFLTGWFSANLVASGVAEQTAAKGASFAQCRGQLRTAGLRDYFSTKWPTHLHEMQSRLPRCESTAETGRHLRLLRCRALPAGRRSTRISPGSFAGIRTIYSSPYRVLPATGPASIHTGDRFARRYLLAHASGTESEVPLHVDDLNVAGLLKAEWSLRLGAVQRRRLCSTNRHASSTTNSPAP